MAEDKRAEAFNSRSPDENPVAGHQPGASDSLHIDSSVAVLDEHRPLVAAKVDYRRFKCDREVVPRLLIVESMDGAQTGKRG